jgi:ribonuclease-3 family protein
MDINNLNILVLAYLGDSVYECYIRRYLINRNIADVNNLQTESIKYVSAKAQKEIVDKLIADNYLTEEELSIFRRARNHKGNRHPKNCDIVTYKYATGFEAIIGYLSLTDNNKRIEEIINYILGGNK